MRVNNAKQNVRNDKRSSRQSKRAILFALIVASASSAGAQTISENGLIHTRSDVHPTQAPTVRGGNIQANPFMNPALAGVRPPAVQLASGQHQHSKLPAGHQGVAALPESEQQSPSGMRQWLTPAEPGNSETVSSAIQHQQQMHSRVGAVKQNPHAIDRPTVMSRPLGRHPSNIAAVVAICTETINPGTETAETVDAETLSALPLIRTQPVTDTNPMQAEAVDRLADNGPLKPAPAGSIELIQRTRTTTQQRRRVRSIMEIDRPGSAPIASTTESDLPEQNFVEPVVDSSDGDAAAQTTQPIFFSLSDGDALKDHDTQNGPSVHRSVRALPEPTVIAAKPINPQGGSPLDSSDEISVPEQPVQPALVPKSSASQIDGPAPVAVRPAPVTMKSDEIAFGEMLGNTKEATRKGGGVTIEEAQSVALDQAEVPGKITESMETAAEAQAPASGHREVVIVAPSRMMAGKIRQVPKPESGNGLAADPTSTVHEESTDGSIPKNLSQVGSPVTLAPLVDLAGKPLPVAEPVQDDGVPPVQFNPEMAKAIPAVVTEETTESVLEARATGGQAVGIADTDQTPKPVLAPKARGKVIAVATLPVKAGRTDRPGRSLHAAVSGALHDPSSHPSGPVEGMTDQQTAVESQPGVDSARDLEQPLVAIESQADRGSETEIASPETIEPAVAAGLDAAKTLPVNSAAVQESQLPLLPPGQPSLLAGPGAIASTGSLIEDNSPTAGQQAAMEAAASGDADDINSVLKRGEAKAKLASARHSTASTSVLVSPTEQSTVPAVTIASETPLQLPTGMVETVSGVDSSSVVLNLKRAQVRSLTIGGRLRRISIDDKDVCQAFVAGTNEIKLIGTGNGQTRLTVWADVKSGEPTRIQTFAIDVSQSVDATGDKVTEHTTLLNDSIDKAFPRAAVVVSQSGGQLLVTGHCDDELTAKQIMRMVRKSCLIPVVDQLKIR